MGGPSFLKCSNGGDDLSTLSFLEHFVGRIPLFSMCSDGVSKEPKFYNLSCCRVPLLEGEAGESRL